MDKPTKQLRVHNWSGIFLDRLNEFYSKTDHCDVTLQFNGNAQLKVHRLVLNVCSNFFGPALINDNITDSNGESIVIMPSDLQADVMLPIINFMYTGLLDYESTMFHKLYKAADLLHMPVLTKLLDSQRTASASVNLLNKNVLKRKPLTPPTNTTLLNTVKKFKPIVSTPTPSSSSILGIGKRKKQFAAKLTKSDPSEQAKPFRFDWPDDYEPQVRPTDVDFGSIPKKAIITYNDYAKVYGNEDMCPNNNNSPPSNTLIDMDAMKDYVKEQKIRADLMHFEKEYEDDYNITKIETRVANKKDTNEEETTLTIKMKNIEAELDHTKIISEVLKKYPDIVKKNKNIRLKIMSDSAKQPQKTIKLTSQLQDQQQSSKVKETPKLVTQPIRNKRTTGLLNETNLGPWKCTKCPLNPEFVLYYLYRKHMIDEHNEHYDNNQCKYCGKKCKNQLLLEYHTHTEHNLQPSKAFIFPKCERCAYIAPTAQILSKHTKFHQMDEVKCDVCELVFVNKPMYLKHLQITNHVVGANSTNSKSKQYEYDCQYCMKRYKAPMNLYTHMKQCHGNDSSRDGVFLCFDMEIDGDRSNEEMPVNSETKVKILSDVRVNEEKKIQQIETIDASELSTVANSLGLVDIVVFNEDDQQYILQQHQPSQIITTSSGTTTTTSDITSTDELVMVLTDHDYNNEGDESIIETNQTDSANNSNIVVLYSHPCDATGQQSFITTTQGNLMVNSETGLIEIHQNATTGEGLVSGGQTQPVASQEGQIESIEMIQREIESHIQQESEQVAQIEENVQQIEEKTETFSETVAPEVQEEKQEEFMELNEATSFELNANVAPVESETVPETEPESEPNIEPIEEKKSEEIEERKEEEVAVEEVPSDVQLTETLTTVVDENVAEKETKCVEEEQQPVVEEENKSGEGGQSSITNIILDDWDDTDSQQSDKPNVMKEASVEGTEENNVKESNGIKSKQTVNKIMDEWDVKDDWESEEVDGRKENVENVATDL